MVTPRRCCRSDPRAACRGLSCASRLDSGSRAVHQANRGLIDDGAPSATRCCWPPESCDGLRSSNFDKSASNPAVLAEARARCSFGRDLAHLQAKQDVFGNRQMGKQRVGLEHHRNMALRRRQSGNIDAADQHRGRRIRPPASGNQAQRRRLCCSPKAPAERRKTPPWLRSFDVPPPPGPRLQCLLTP